MKLGRIMTGAALGIMMACGFGANAFAKLPANMEEFQARFEKEAATPEGAAKLWLESVFVYQNNETRSLGRQMLMATMKGLPDDFDRNAGYAKMMERIKGNPEIFRSFCAGSSPENNYKADVNNCELTVTSTREENENTRAVFLQSSGADSPRPIKMSKDGNTWKAYSVSSLYLQIKPAKK